MKKNLKALIRDKKKLFEFSFARNFAQLCKQVRVPNTKKRK